jgi:hypothetical protein
MYSTYIHNIVLTYYAYFDVTCVRSSCVGDLSRNFFVVTTLVFMETRV